MKRVFLQPANQVCCTIKCALGFTYLVIFFFIIIKDFGSKLRTFGIVHGDDAAKGTFTKLASTEIPNESRQGDYEQRVKKKLKKEPGLGRSLFVYII